MSSNTPTKQGGLLCFEPERYWVVLDDTDYQCIAPTKSGSQCSWPITTEELDEVRQLTAEAQTLGEGDERNYVLQRLVLIRTCGESHREKLQARAALDCLEKVTNKYAEAILRQSSQGKRTHMVLRSSVKKSSSKPPPLRYVLQPRHVGPFKKDYLQSSYHAITESPFVPYQSDPNDHIKDVLLSDVPSEPRAYTQTGCVYAFTWPSNPEFVKIGYSGKTAESRMSKWRKCHPGATVDLERKIAFPRRMERLIHLEMARKRHKILICAVCSSQHEEWFKASLTEVRQVIQNWQMVTDKIALYTTTGQITQQWREIVDEMTGEITAATLLDAFEARTKQTGNSENVPVFLDTEKMTERLQEILVEKENEPTVGALSGTAEAARSKQTDDREDSAVFLNTSQADRADGSTALDMTAQPVIASSTAASSNETIPPDSILQQSADEISDQILSFLADFMNLLATQEDITKQSINASLVVQDNLNVVTPLTQSVA